ncbi:ATP synthase F1 subunit delta [Caldimicrobium thiodismutans]|uniref:ATP synthase subunit delta n=1 Tax=Caldimicrobium thiodismutans TaxID=1653476 RepID=A0A0U4N0H0_9BACT|nr:ATP synthase F1 subunit delta [Caldimicrobium thiodismutans]BAU22694.1 ATP synthase F1 subunit delta [Caldimicrobium thiodismutans]
MRAVATALKYAKGLFIAAKELNKVKEFGEELENLATGLKGYPEILQALQSPIYPPDIKQEILQEILSYFKVDPEIERFLKLLVERRRIQFLEEIVAMYQALLDEELGRARGEVITAFPISDDERVELERALQTLLKKEVILEAKVDPEIIGGVKVKVGDYILDGTLKSQLEKFKEIIIKGV